MYLSGEVFPFFPDSLPKMDYQKAPSYMLEDHKKLWDSYPTETLPMLVENPDSDDFMNTTTFLDSLILQALSRGLLGEKQNRAGLGPKRTISY